MKKRYEEIKLSDKKVIVICDHCKLEFIMVCFLIRGNKKFPAFSVGGIYCPYCGKYNESSMDGK